MGRANPIHVIGDPMRHGVTYICDELIRDGAHQTRLGSDGFVAFVFLLSWASRKNAWETSAKQISATFGWGANRNRARAALNMAVKDKRLVIRSYIRDGQIVPRRCVYVIADGGRQLTDLELAEYSKPIPLPSKNMHCNGATT